jgi:DNA-directed RNA polymerase specialized sigma24 family protein
MEPQDYSSELSVKLDTVIRLLAMVVIKGRDFKDQVRLLDQAGLKPKDIAEILGKSPNAIRVALFSVRRSRGTP